MSLGKLGQTQFPSQTATLAKEHFFCAKSQQFSLKKGGRICRTMCQFLELDLGLQEPIFHVLGLTKRKPLFGKAVVLMITKI
jgi:hypothetical protein